MASKRKPQKRSRPLGYIEFSGKGKISKVIEELPKDKVKLETKIVQKFLGSLRHFENREIVTLKESDPWPDFEAIEGLSKIGIEVVEIVNTDHLKLQSLQKKYEDEILTEIADVLDHLNGLRITIDDGYQFPPYPKLNSIEGRKLVQSISTGIKSSISHLQTVEVGMPFLKRWSSDPNSPRTGIYGLRVADKNSGLRADIGFSGSFPESHEAIVSSLRKTIKRKIDTNYTQYADGKLMLLVYEVSLSVHPDESAAINEARVLLSQRNHPFDEIWYFFPYAAEDLGAIQRVWP